MKEWNDMKRFFTLILAALMAAGVLPVTSLPAGTYSDGGVDVL